MFPNIANAPVTMYIAILSMNPAWKNSDVKKQIRGDRYIVPVDRMLTPV